MKRMGDRIISAVKDGALEVLAGVVMLALCVNLVISYRLTELVAPQY